MPDHRHASIRPAGWALVLVWVLLACHPGATVAGEPGWQELRPGLDLGFIMVEASLRAGSPRLAVLRVDPERFRFRVLTAPEGQDGYSAAEWRKRSRALAVFNAGQFTAERTYLGLLIQDGKTRGNLVNHLEALFLAEPDDPLLPRARVVDLHYTAFEAKNNPYRQAAQSLMFLDRFGQIRVRRSQKAAHRTLVAEDGQGRIWVMVSEGKHTLYELARVVSESNLGLREVMCMDGGAEAQLDLQVGEISYQQAGGPSESPDLPLPWPPANLLAALAIFPR
ncbi:MAG: phosphodiester glycosidase family protein [Desulfarculus sp.]|nr:phosphodiester glycosidase family protein [Desulfarculus sp.]